MCGIVAVVSPRGGVSVDWLKKGMDRLVHRGPDSQHAWVAEHGRAGLGHTRLSIIDLETGDQPLHSEQQDLHLVANGEFYGFEGIRERLQAEGLPSTVERTAASLEDVFVAATRMSGERAAA